jgi:hypothetical protein
MEQLKKQNIQENHQNENINSKPINLNKIKLICFYSIINILQYLNYNQE